MKNIIKIPSFLKSKMKISGLIFRNQDKHHNNAYFKSFRPTIKCLEKFKAGGRFDITLNFNDSEGVNITKKYPCYISKDELNGLKFKVIVPEILNIGGVQDKGSYGLNKKLQLSKNSEYFIIERDSVTGFKTKYPTKPQILEGRFLSLKSENNLGDTYKRLIIPVSDVDMIFPTAILGCRDNYMKFDDSNWNLQEALLGFSFRTTKGMFTKICIKGKLFHFYGFEPLNSQIIDSLDKISNDEFRQITYVIRLCFAFLSGKFYQDEVFYLNSCNPDFSKINDFCFEVEEHSIITINQLINPIIFRNQNSQNDAETKKSWDKFETNFSNESFSQLCEKVLDSTELMRSIELIISAGKIGDPKQKGALYSISVETITTYLKTKNEEAYKPIKDKKINESFTENLLKCLLEIKAELDEESYGILEKKIIHINSPTNRDKLLKPFTLLGIELTEDEIKALDNRNLYLHGKFPKNIEWLTELHSIALKIHNLIALVILKYIGYKGHIINLSGWYMLNQTEIHNIHKDVDLEKIERIRKAVETKSIKPEEFESAKQIIDDFQKYLKALKEIQEIIKIVE